MMRRLYATAVSLIACLCVTMPALAQCDTTGPFLADLSLSATSVDTSLADQIVTCTMTLTDGPAGVSEAACLFISPVYLQSQTCVAQVPVSGTAQNGVYECSVTLPRYSEAGVWTVSIDLVDKVSNRLTFVSLDLLSAGLPADLTVTSDADTLAPELTAFSLSPAGVTVSAGPQAVTCSATLSDAKAGVDLVECVLTAPGLVQEQVCTSATPASGNRQNGTFQCVVQIPQFAEAGIWQAKVSFLDQAGNGVTVSTDELQLAGFSKDLAVTSAPQDVTPPVQTGFSFAPMTIDSFSGSTPVACTLNVIDDLAGVEAIGCTFFWIDPGFLYFQFQSCNSATPASGTRLNGVFACEVVLPRYSAAGQWFASTVVLDAVGNTSQFLPATPLDVQCGAPATEVTSQWLDPSILSWNAMAGAGNYNVYRRTSNGLADGDENGLPDGGYGDCQNGSDPDPTDTLFIDTALPATASQVFMYLVGFTDTGGETGLGDTSDGTGRAVVPCP